MRVKLSQYFDVSPFLSDVSSSEPARRLFDDLLSRYNRLVRPVSNHSQTLIVKLKLKLSQLLDVVSMSMFKKCLIK